METTETTSKRAHNAKARLDTLEYEIRRTQELVAHLGEQVQHLDGHFKEILEIAQEQRAQRSQRLYQ
jgi:hypothetical protein